MAKGVSRGFNGLRNEMGLVATQAKALPPVFSLTGTTAQAAIGGAVGGAFATASNNINNLQTAALALPAVFSTASKGVVQSLDAMGDASIILDAEFTALGEPVALLEHTTARTAGRVSGLFGRMTTAAGGFFNRLGGLIPMFGDIRRIAGRNIGSLDAVFRRVGRSVFNLRNAILGLGAALAARSIVQAGLRFDKIRLSIEAVTASSTEAREEFGFVESVADSLGLSLQTTARSYAKLLASSKGTAIEGQNMRAIFLGVAKAATALSMSADESEGALRAVQQMISKGNVQAEELRGQLGERLPGAFNLSAEAMGVTTQELNKMLDRGEVLAADLLPRLADVLEERFGKGAENAAQSVRASFNRLGTSFFRLQAEVARSGVNDALAEIAQTLSDLFNEMVRDGRAEAFGRAIATAIRGIGFVAAKTTEILSAFFQGLDEFFAQMSNRIASFMHGVDFQEVNKLFEQEKMAQAVAALRGHRDSGMLSIPAVVAQGNDLTPQSVLDDFDELIKGIERRIKLNRELATSARDGADAQDALVAAFEAEQEVAKLGFTNAEEKAAAVSRLTDANMALLQSERDLQKVEDDIQRERERAIDTATTIADLRFERDGLIRLNEAREDSIEAFQRERSAQAANLIIRRLGIESISKEADEIRQLVAEIDRLSQSVEQPINVIQKAFVSAVSNMEDALVDFVTTGKIEFEDLANSILRDINRIFIRQLITQPLVNSIAGRGDAGIFSGIAGLFGNRTAAQGGVFTQPFIGGEAGPEAAVPLPDGRSIPVEMRGGGSTVINLNVTPPETRPMMDSERQMLREAGNQIARQVNRATN